MQNEKEKIALFDFCDTLVDFQTANAYVRYCIKHHATLVVGFRYFFYRVLRRLKLLKYIDIDEERKKEIEKVMKTKLKQHQKYINQFGIDMPEIVNWNWNN